MKIARLYIIEADGQTKIQQLVHSITEAISNGSLKEGAVVPSVNQLSSQSGFSRDTVFKAYNILKKRAVIESAPAKGYFVANESYKVFMRLDDFSAFKEQLYQSFRKNLPDTYSVDLLFHHYNEEVFNQLVQNSLGRYSMYVVMNIDHRTISPALDKIDSNKLLVLDMGNPSGKNNNYLIQDFNQAVFQCLEKGLPQLSKYNEMVMVYSEKDTPHPAETVTAVKRFCESHQIYLKKINSVETISLKKGQAWFVIRDADLVEVIKKCRAKDLKLGQDVGVLSYNDSPMKQIVGGGISVISVDFEKMGQLAARFVKNKQPIEKVLPTFLTLRESL
ncbi:MAG: GntR family transcriptional regulator [Spirochaetales bacterium]|jgi:DNA-binding transcriptional regulator YhcF (GntR family)|nr:GntR family transcriptional regulator [Spirochaetales bacterium]